MMKCSVLCLAFAAGCALAPASVISDFFISEPDSLFALIDKSVRMDMVDYYNSGKKIEVDNRMDGLSKIEDLSETYMKVELSESADMELKMHVEGKSDTVLVAVKTLRTPVADSQFMAFDRYWAPLDADKYFKMPGVSDFLKGVSGKEKDELLNLVDFPLVSLELDRDGNITAHLTLGGYMIKANYDKLKPYVVEKLVYRWDGKKYRLQK